MDPTLAGRARRTEEWLRAHHHPSTAAARLAGESPPGIPTVVLLGSEPDEPTAEALAAASNPGRSGVAIVAMGEPEGARWHWTMSPSTIFAPLDSQVRPLGAGAPAAVNPGPESERAPTEPPAPVEPAPLRVSSTVEVKVRCGGPEVEGASSTPESPAAQKLIVFLALHGGTAPHHQWVDAVASGKAGFAAGAVAAAAAHALRGPARSASSSTATERPASTA